MQKLVLVGCAAICAAVTFGETFVWKGGADSSWHTAANWEPETVPNASGAAVDLSAASGTITFTSAVTVGSLTFAPTSGKTLTISGNAIKMTFAGPSTPTVTVGSGSTLITQCYHGGSQGLVKLGAGAFNPLANKSVNNFGGAFEVREGSSAPVYEKNNPDGCFSGGIKVMTGATFTQTSPDMYASSQAFEIAGGKMLMKSGDYVGAITLNNGGVFDASNQQLYLDNGAAMKATGTGVAGTLQNMTLRVNGVFSQPASNPIHIQPFDVASGASLFFQGNIYEGLHQPLNGDHYVWDYRNACAPSQGANRKFLYGGMVKKGAGDLILHGGGRSTLTKETTIEAGRLVLSNNYSLGLSTVVASNAAALKLASGQTSVRVGGLLFRDGTLDLGGNTLDVGGADGSAVMSTKASNGAIRKVSHTTQTVAGLAQSTLDVYGGMLNLGIPAPIVRYDFDDAGAPLNDSGALGKHLSWSSADAGLWHRDGGVRGGCVEMTKSGSWGRSGANSDPPSTWVYTYGGGWLEAATCEGLPAGGSKPISISVWIKPNAAVTSKQALVSWGRWGAELNPAGNGNAGGYKAMGLCAMSENTLFARPWSGDWNSTAISNLSDGNWHHVVYVYDPAYHVDRYYVDGNLFQESRTLPTDEFKIDMTRMFTVGGGQLYANTFMGKIDEVMVFDQALGADQVKLLASSADTTKRPATLGANATVNVARDATLGFMAASQTLSALSGDGKLVLGDAEVTLDNAAAATAATVTGSGTLTKRGAGDLTLGRATATGGRLAIDQGAVALKGGSTSSELRSHLKGYWNFNDPANPLADSSGHGLDLMPNTRTDAHGSTSFEHEAWNWRNHFEKMGGAAYFGGDNKETLICTNGPALTAALPRGNASFTIALWVNADSSCAGNGTFFTYYHDHRTENQEGRKWNMLRFNNSKKNLHHVFYGGGDKSATRELDGTFCAGDEFTGWHHVVYTYDKDKRIERFYLNGVQFGDDVASGGDVPDMQTGLLCIGGSRDIHQNDGAPFKGGNCKTSALTACPSA